MVTPNLPRTTLTSLWEAKPQTCRDGASSIDVGDDEFLREYFKGKDWFYCPKTWVDAPAAEG